MEQIKKEYIEELMTKIKWKTPEIQKQRIEEDGEDVVDLMLEDDPDFYEEGMNCFEDRVNCIMLIHGVDSKKMITYDHAAVLAVLSWWVGYFDIPGATHKQRADAIGANITEYEWEVFDTMEEVADDTLNNPVQFYDK